MFDRRYLRLLARLAMRAAITATTTGLIHLAFWWITRH